MAVYWKQTIQWQVVTLTTWLQRSIREYYEVLHIHTAVANNPHLFNHPERSKNQAAGMKYLNVITNK